MVEELKNVYFSGLRESRAGPCITRDWLRLSLWSPMVGAPVNKQHHGRFFPRILGGTAGVAGPILQNSACMSMTLSCGLLRTCKPTVGEDRTNKVCLG